MYNSLYNYRSTTWADIGQSVNSVVASAGSNYGSGGVGGRVVGPGEGDRGGVGGAIDGE